DGLLGPRSAVAQLGDPVVHENGVTDEDRSDKAPVVDAEEGDCGFAQLSGPGPHQAMRIGKAQHPMRHPASELTGPGIDIAGVKFRKVAGQPGKAYQIRIGDGPAGTAEGKADAQVFITIRGSDGHSGSWGKGDRREARNTPPGS